MTTSRQTHNNNPNNSLLSDELLLLCIDELEKGQSLDALLRMPEVLQLSDAAKQELRVLLSFSATLFSERNALPPPSERLLRDIIAAAPHAPVLPVPRVESPYAPRRLRYLADVSFPRIIAISFLFLVVLFSAVRERTAPSVPASPTVPGSADGVVRILSEEATSDTRAVDGDDDSALLSIDAPSMNALEQAYDDQTL